MDILFGISRYGWEEDDNNTHHKEIRGQGQEVDLAGSV
jgi:hypothetical protein